jgi:hypothetical protein
VWAGRWPGLLALVRPDVPSATQVREAIAGAVRRFGGRGCAGGVAQEFGDHQEVAAARMRWARRVTGEAFGGAGLQAWRSRQHLVAGRAA